MQLIITKAIVRGDLIEQKAFPRRPQCRVGLQSDLVIQIQERVEHTAVAKIHLRRLHLTLGHTEAVNDIETPRVE